MRAAVALLALVLAACAHDKTPPPAEFPQLPDLPAIIVPTCPALPALDGSLGDLAQKDAGAAVAYAKCKARGDFAVGAYGDAQRALRAAESRAGTGAPSK